MEKVDNKTVYLENQLYSSKENGKWGFVDLKDNVIVDYQYDEITEINQYGFAGIKKMVSGELLIKMEKLF